MKSTLKQLTPLLIVFTALLAGDLISAASWNPPTGAPSTSNNAPEPINVSVDAQTKGGQLNALRYRAISRMMSPEYCDTSGGNCFTPGGTLYASQYCDVVGNCIDGTSLVTGSGGSIDTSTFLNTSATNQTKTGGLAVGSINVSGNSTVGGNSIVTGQTRSNTYCDRWGNNCSSASDIFTLISSSGGSSIDTSSFLDTSATNQTKSGSLTANNLNANGAVTSNGNVTAGNKMRAPLYCNETGGSCSSPEDLKAAVNAILNDGITIECVSGVHREGGGTAIQTSSLGNNYSFSSVFVASFRNSQTQPEIRCTGGWTMTGCSAGTNGGTADNDESMDGRNMCVGDQTGDNAIHARCCRVVIQ